MGPVLRRNLVDSVAEAIWQSESMRATGKPRREKWNDLSLEEKERLRWPARAAVRVMRAHNTGDY
jgi:hypothetical protein